jgi:hypothetical protein
VILTARRLLLGEESDPARSGNRLLTVLVLQLFNDYT